MQPHSDLRPGTVIHGTMRDHDLIPAFIAELASYGQDVEPWILEIADRLEKDLDYPDSQDDAHYVDEACAALFDQLDALGGEHFYFGAHAGDGSDYGFWPASDLP